MGNPCEPCENLWMFCTHFLANYCPEIGNNLGWRAFQHINLLAKHMFQTQPSITALIISADSGSFGGSRRFHLGSPCSVIVYGIFMVSVGPTLGEGSLLE